MKLKLTLFACLIALSVVAWAQTTPKLVVWLKSGEKVYFDLDEEPRTTFNNGLLIISTNSKALETSYQLDKVQRYTHEGVSTDIAETASRDLVVAQSNDALTLKNVPNGTPVQLYDPAGRLLETKTGNGASTIQFSLASRPSGVYLVKINDQTFKISKR
jgi:hypothetical protein